MDRMHRAINPFVGQFPKAAFASLPAASAVRAGTIYNVSDIGTAGSLFISNGTIWRPLNGQCVLASSAVAAVLTGSVSETTLATITIPAGLMTANGIVWVNTLWSNNNSGNNKTMLVRFNGTGGTAYLSSVVTTSLSSRYMTSVQNRNSASSQVGMSSTGIFAGTSSQAVVTTAVDTTAATSIVIRGTLANSGDTLTLEAYEAILRIP